MSYGSAPYAGTAYAGEASYPVVNAVASRTLGGLSCSATATAPAAAAVANTLAPTTSSAATTAPLAAAASKTLAGLTPSATATLSLAVSLTKTLANLTLTSTSSAAIATALSGRTNLLYNGDGAGASGAAWPSGWVTGQGWGSSLIPSSWTTGTDENGSGYAQFRINGTTTTGNRLLLDFYKDGTPTRIPVTAGQSYTVSLSTKLVSLTTGVFTATANPQILWYDAANALISAPTGAGPTITTTRTRSVLTAVAPVGAVTAIVRLDFNQTFTSGTAFDFTVQVGAVQFEQSAVPTRYVQTTAGAAPGGYLMGDPVATNYARNAAFIGAIAGTPGTTPTSMVVGQDAGIGRQIVGVGIENTPDGDLPYLDMRIFGTPTIVGEIFTFQSMSGNTEWPAAAQGEAWSIGWSYRMVGGTAANISSMGATLYGRTSGGLANADNIASNYAPPTSTYTRATASRTLNSATTAYVTEKLILISADTTTPINITIRVYAPQVEKSAYPTKPIITDGVTKSRGAQGVTAYTRAIGYDRTANLFKTMTSAALTNLVPNSTDPTVWNNNTFVTVGSAGLAPWGLMQARLFVPTTDNNAHGSGQASIGATPSGTAVVGSVFAKAGGYTKIAIGSNFGATTIFDLLAGTCTGNGTIFSCGDGWYRCSVPFVTGGGSGTYLVILDASGSSVFVGDGVSGVWFAGLQHQTGSVLGEYVPTTGSTASISAHGLSGSAAATEVATADLGYRVNYIRNNSMLGAAAGTPGTLPTNWTRNASAGLAINVVGTGTEFGLPYIDVRVVGTETGTNSQTMLFDAISTAPAAAGQTWTLSAGVRLIAGSLTNISNTLIVGGTSTNGTSIAAFFGIGSTTPTASFSRFSTTGVAGASTVNAVGYFQVNTTPGAIDATYRIYAPQLEQNTAASPVILTTGSVTAAGAYLGDRVSTNGAYYSQDFDNGYWTKAAASVSANSVVAPDGTTTADLVSNTPNVGSYVYQNTTLTLARYVTSVYAKASTGTNVLFIEAYDGVTLDRAGFNLSTGTVTFPPAVNGSTAGIIDVGGGWYRCWMSLTILNLTNARASLFYVGAYGSTATSTSIALWGAQVELGSTPTAYMRTAAGAVTRGAQGMTLNADDAVTVTASLLRQLTNPGRTNLMLNSCHLSSWPGQSNVVVSADQIVAPDGTKTADMVTDSTSNAAHCVFGPNGTLTAALHTASVYLKAGTLRYISFRTETIATSNYPWVTLDTQTGTLSANASATAYSVTDVGNGWFRVAVTWNNFNTTGSTSNLVVAGSNVATAPGVTNSLGNGYIGTGQTFYVWGAQIELGATASEHILTTGSTAARSAHGLGGTLNASAAGACTLIRDLTEPATTNLAKQSQDFNLNGPWLVPSTTVTANQVAAPDGTVTADLLTPTADGASKAIYQTLTTAAGVHTNSIYVKAAGGRWFGLGFGNSTKTDGAFFDLTNGVVGTVAAGTTASILALTNGWYRVSVTRTLTAGTNYIQVEPHSADNQNGAWTSVAGAETFYLWGAQAEAGLLTTYQPTQAAAVARTAHGLSGTLTTGATASARVSKKNLLSYSNLFRAGVTTTTDYSVTNGLADSSGGFEGTTLADISTSVRTPAQVGTEVLQGRGTYTAQIQVKKAAGQTDTAGDIVPSVFRVQDPSGGALFGVNFNAFTGAISGAGTPLFGVIDQGNGWWLVWWTFTISATSGTGALQLFPSHNSASSNTGSVTLGDFQIEEGTTRTAIERVKAPTQGKILDNATIMSAGGPITGASLAKTLSSMSISGLSGVIVAANLSKSMNGLIRDLRAKALRRRMTQTVRSLVP